MGDFIDWSGKNFKIVGSDEKEVTVKIRANVNDVYFWALQYGSVVEVIKPDALRNKIREGLESMLEKYK